MEKLDLADLFNKYGSDKDRNGYSPLYSILFDKIKINRINLLEIGIGTMTPNATSSMKGYMPDHYIPGASLRAWRDYFINGKIYGVDIQEDTIFNETRIETYLCNSINTDDVNSLMKKLNIKFDIIIDDGWHWDEAQKQTLINFFPYLKEGGIYVIEDVCVGSILNTQRGIIQKTVGNNEYFFAGLSNNQCVIRKKPINTISGY
jgi:hypothetical protein